MVRLRRSAMPTSLGCQGTYIASFNNIQLHCSTKPWMDYTQILYLINLFWRSYVHWVLLLYFTCSQRKLYTKIILKWYMYIWYKLNRKCKIYYIELINQDQKNQLKRIGNHYIILGIWGLEQDQFHIHILSAKPLI